MKKALSLLLACVMVFSLAACGSKEETPAAAETETETTAEESSESEGGVFKIGGTGPLTGGAAIYGLAVQNGAQIAVDEINAAGGINGVQIEFDYQDDEHDAEKAVNAYNALKDWGVQVIMGSVTSTPCIAVDRKSVV